MNDINQVCDEIGLQGPTDGSRETLEAKCADIRARVNKLRQDGKSSAPLLRTSNILAGTALATSLMGLRAEPQGARETLNALLKFSIQALASTIAIGSLRDLYDGGSADGAALLATELSNNRDALDRKRSVDQIAKWKSGKPSLGPGAHR